MRAGTCVRLMGARSRTAQITDAEDWVDATLGINESEVLDRYDHVELLNMLRPNDTHACGNIQLSSVSGRH